MKKKKKFQFNVCVDPKIPQDRNPLTTITRRISSNSSGSEPKPPRTIEQFQNSVNGKHDN